MRNLKIYGLVVILSISFAGCSSDVSKCEDSKIKEKAIKTIRNNIGATNFIIESTQDEGLNKEETARKCSAIITSTNSSGIPNYLLRMKFNYIIKKTNDGEIVEFVKENQAQQAKKNDNSEVSKMVDSIVGPGTSKEDGEKAMNDFRTIADKMLKK